MPPLPRAIIIATRGGRIQFMSRGAGRMLRRYLEGPLARGRLPLPLRRWVRSAGMARPLWLTREGMWLGICLLNLQGDGSCCLILHELTAKERPMAQKELTPREEEVVKLSEPGLLNKEIASKLGVSKETVRTHLQNAFAKLGVRNRAEAARALRERESGVFGWRATTEGG